MPNTLYVSFSTMTEGPELLEAHFSDEDMEALRGELARLRSQRMWLGLNLVLSDSEIPAP